MDKTMQFKKLFITYILAIFVGFLLFILYSVYVQNPYSIPFKKTKMFAKENRQYVIDKKLGYKPAPNFSGYSDLAAYTDIHYDHLGARVNSPLQQTPDKVDLITIGCSQAWGQGVTNTDTFTQQVAAINGMQVANLGVSSYGGVESYLRLKENLKLQPKYVVYAFWEDHFNRNLILCNQTTPSCVERPVLKNIGNNQFTIRYPRFSDLTYKINQRWFEELADYTNDATYSRVKASLWAAIKPLEASRKIVNKINGFDLKATEQDKIPGAKYIIQQMQDAANEVGAKLIVLYIPYNFDANISPMPNELAAYLDTQNIAVIDLTAEFKKMYADGIPVTIPDDGHINKESHHVIAKSIATKIAELENSSSASDNQSNANSAA